MSNLPNTSDSGSGQQPAIHERESMPVSAAAPTVYVEPEGDLNHLLNALFRRRWLIGGIVAGCLAVAIAVILLATPRYSAEVRILLERRADAFSSALESAMPGIALDATALNSQVEVLRSRTLTREVVEQLQLGMDPEFNPALRPPGLLRRVKQAFQASAAPLAPAIDAAVIDTVQRRLNVRPIEGSEVIALRFSSQDPTKAAAIANAFYDQYLAQQLESKRQTTARTSAWLDESVTELGKKVAVAEQAVEDFRRQSGIIESGGQTLTAQDISGLNSQLLLARSATAQAEARLAQVRTLVRSGADAITASEVLDSPLIQRLREQETELTRRRAEMASDLGPEHPRMAQLEAEAKDLQAKIKTEIDKIVQRLQNEVRIARAQEESLSGQLDQLKTRTGENNEQQIQMRALEREAEANRNLLATLLARYTAQTNGALQQSDARIVSAAEAPTEPSFPNAPVILGLVTIGSLLLAGAVVLLLEMRDRSFHSGDDIERVLGIPSLGLVPLAPNMDAVQKNGALETLANRSLAAFRESLHTLNWTIALANRGQPPRSVLITSAQPDEGKTTIALGLASFQAMIGRKVLLIDADTRKAALPARYGRPDMQGLTDVLR
ncbi:MAG TPA: exopolysaccharide transport family protein, partial [Vicinamibacterales bacterium]|nr:exopolysaccharide transport family protein [Vicinamibacterales bacterium]